MASSRLVMWRVVELAIVAAAFVLATALGAAAHANGAVIGKSAFRGTGTEDVAAFVEARLKVQRKTVLLRLEGFNLFNRTNLLGRAQTIYGDGAAPNATFGQLVAPGVAASAQPSLANIDPPRMFQLQARF